MISKFAIDEIDKMQEEGLSPSPRDIIRLNAIGMKVHAAQGKAVRNTAYLLPRVAVLEGGKTFREPSIGHEVWIDAISRFIVAGDYSSELAINCFALSRSVSDLPSLDNLDEVSTIIKSFCDDYKDYTVRQLDTAIRYVKFGADWIDEEKSAKRECANDNDSPIEDDEASDLASDPNTSIAIGVLRDGITVLSGLTLAEMKEMPRREVESAIRKACWVRGKNIGTDEESAALGDFYETRNEIKNRLIKEKENGSAPSI